MDRQHADSGTRMALVLSEPLCSKASRMKGVASGINIQRLRCYRALVICIVRAMRSRGYE